MKNAEIDPYELCLCGSGEKYKFCCYKNKDIEFHNADEFNIYIQKNKPKLSLCIHQDNDCRGGIIKSHSIQNNKIISKLSVDNHVYIVDFSSNSGIAGNDFKKCGKNDATISKSFCSFHDDKIFKPIEINDYENTKEQNFLFAYRAFSKHYYDMSDHLNSERLIFKTMSNKYRKIPMKIIYLRGLNIEVKKHDEIKNIFNLALDKKKFDIIETYTIQLNYEIQFATSYMAPLSYDLAGNQVSDIYSLTDDMKYIFVSMFPENKKTYILISWLSKDSKYFEEFRKQLDILQTKRNSLINFFNNLLASQTDNFIISPKLLDRWDENKRKNFLAIFSATFLGTNNIKNLGQEIEKNLISFPCKFDLFEDINF